MGSLIDKIREDEEEYYWICKELGIKTPHDETSIKTSSPTFTSWGNMYVHLKEICDQYGVPTKWELKDIINKIKTREIKIEQLLKDNEI